MKKKIFLLATALMLMAGAGVSAQTTKTVKTDKKKTTQTTTQEVCDNNCRDCSGDKIGCKFEKKDAAKAKTDAKKGERSRPRRKFPPRNADSGVLINNIRKSIQTHIN